MIDLKQELQSLIVRDKEKAARAEKAKHKAIMIFKRLGIPVIDGDTLKVGDNGTMDFWPVSAKYKVERYGGHGINAAITCLMERT